MRETNRRRRKRRHLRASERGPGVRNSDPHTLGIIRGSWFPGGNRKRIRSWARDGPHGRATLYASLTLRELGIRNYKIPSWFAFRLGVDPKLLHRKCKGLTDYDQEKSTYVRVLYHLYKTASAGVLPLPHWLRLATSPDLRYTAYQVSLPHWRKIREVIRTSCRRLRSSLETVPLRRLGRVCPQSPDPLSGFSPPMTEALIP